MTRRKLERKIKEISQSSFGTTYIASAVALECAGVDLDICTISQNSSALEVSCPPPGIGAKIQGSFSENKSGITYFGRSVAFKSAVINREITTSNCNSTALQVACSPRRDMEKHQENSVRICGTYLVGFIQAKTTCIDLHAAILSINSTALEVACPPGIRAKI
jgi:hypothetical protein